MLMEQWVSKVEQEGAWESIVLGNARSAMSLAIDMLSAGQTCMFRPHPRHEGRWRCFFLATDEASQVVRNWRESE